MPSVLVSVMAGLVVLYALFARRIDRVNITAPMLSILAGALVFGLSGMVDIEAASIHLIAEVTLVVVLFHDASTVRLAQLRHDKGIPIRLLAIGFPVALLATLLSAWAFLPALGLAGAALLSGSVTPTDAGLGAPTILNPEVPVRVRRALNVESGLNDGLATPFVLIALSALAGEEGTESPTLLQVSVVPVVMALALALVVAVVAAWLLDRSAEHHWSSHRGRMIAVLVLPLLILGLAEVTGANGFIAAFVGGLAFGAASGALAADETISGLLEITADLLGFVVWFLAGGLVLLVFDDGVRWQWPVFAVLVLTVLRIVPVWLSLLGTTFRWQTVTFIGWFGPRGLASIVFALLAVEELGPDDPVMRDFVGVVTFVVLFSVFAHGITAAPLSKRYGAWVHRVHPPIEREPSAEPAGTRGRIH
jgi:sodium/hydrogen antiporter